MVRKKSSSTKNLASKTKNVLTGNAVLEDKIIYAMANTSVILMSTMMGAFTQVMVPQWAPWLQEWQKRLGGKEASEKVDKEIKQGLPEIDEKMKAMISDIRKDIYAQMKQKKPQLKKVLSDPAFEVGPKIIEKYDFNLPKLTQELDDIALSRYSQLIVGEDENFAKMFKELTEWISSLPKP